MAPFMHHTAAPQTHTTHSQMRGMSAPTQTEEPVSSAALLRGHKTVAIAHNGMLYTLQATKMGKLILTK